MAEEQHKQENQTKKATPASVEADRKVEKPAGKVADRSFGKSRRPAPAGGKGGQSRDGSTNKREGRSRGRRPEREPREFDQQILDLARVTRVTKGGKRMRFRVTMVIGDRKGQVGYGIAKGLDVQTSVQKAVNQARKKLITVPLQNETIPHAVSSKFAGAQIILKPAPKGTGIKAGGAVRVVLEFAGVPNVTGKILGSKSKINNTKATIQALKRLMPPLKNKPSTKATADGEKKDKGAAAEADKPVKA